MNVKEVLTPRSNIDDLLENKVKDYELIEEMPMRVWIGKESILVGNFTLHNSHRFFNEYGRLMAHLGLKYVNFDHLGDGSELYMLCMKNRKWYKGMIRIIKRTILRQQGYLLDTVRRRQEVTWKNCSERYFVRHVSIESLLQIVKLVHLYNFDAEKKNFQILLGSLDTGPLTETYMYSWLRNLPGLTGKFQLALYQKPESLDSEYQKLQEAIGTNGPKTEDV